MLCYLIIAIGFINFLSCTAFGGQLGGTAVSDYQESGRFYVSNRGRLTQVSEANWKLIWLWGISLYITHPLSMVAMFYLSIKERSAAMIFSGDKEKREQKEAEVHTSPIIKPTFYCAGKIGMARLNRMTLKVTIHTNGLHFRPSGMTPFGIATSEIVEFMLCKDYLRDGIEIQHTSPEIAKPIILFLDDDSNAFEKMKQMKQFQER